MASIALQGSCSFAIDSLALDDAWPRCAQLLVASTRAWRHVGRVRAEERALALSRHAAPGPEQWPPTRSRLLAVAPPARPRAAARKTAVHATAAFMARDGHRAREFRGRTFGVRASTLRAEGTSRSTQVPAPSVNATHSTHAASSTAMAALLHPAPCSPRSFPHETKLPAPRRVSRSSSFSRSVGARFEGAHARHSDGVVPSPVAATGAGSRPLR